MNRGLILYGSLGGHSTQKTRQERVQVKHLGHNCPRAPALVPTLTVLITQTPRMPVSSAVWVWPASWCLKTRAAA